MALDLYSDVDLYYIETGAAHPDNERFKADCEAWYGKPIYTIQNAKGYKNPIDVIYKTGYVNGPDGAKCTQELKKEVRYTLEAMLKPNLFEIDKPIITGQIFGFEFDKKEINRAIRFLQQFYNVNPKFPLIEKGMTKNNCAAILINAGIELPVMYKLGYSNNNCIGCVKGGKGYWNKIRVDFPETFTAMEAAERHAGHSCINGTFLDELNPKSGDVLKEVMPECGNFCEIEFADIPDKNLEAVIEGKISIYETRKQAA